MGRPRILEDRVVVPIVLTSSLKRALEEECRKAGLSMSALIRHLIEEWLKKRGREINYSKPIKVKPKSNPLKPLSDLDYEELKESIAELENQVNYIINKVQLGYKHYGGFPAEMYDRLKYVNERWHSLRKLIYRLGNEGYDVLEEAKKLVEIKKKIKDIWKMRRRR